MFRRIVFLAILAALLSIALAPFAVAQEEGNPAVVIEQEAPSDDVPAWTYRYLVPAGLLLVVLLVAATTVQYFVKVVRARYRVIQ